MRIMPMMPSELEGNPFENCDGAAELFVALFKVNGSGSVGLDAVKTLIGLVGYRRSYMRSTAEELKRLGFADLGDVVAEAAKTVPLGEQTFAQRLALRHRLKRQRDRAKAKAEHKAG
jgi:hypothetical protein